jgi:hypothetical protein
MAIYNRTRYAEELLEKTDSLPPSFTIHLHLEYWTLNNGSKFLYNNQIAVWQSFLAIVFCAHCLMQSLLDDVRAHRIPVDFLDLFEAAKVPFYDGVWTARFLWLNVDCLVFRMHDCGASRLSTSTEQRPYSREARTDSCSSSPKLWDLLGRYMFAKSKARR